MLTEIKSRKGSNPWHMDLTKVMTVREAVEGDDWCSEIWVAGEDEAFPSQVPLQDLLKLVNDAQGDPSYIARLLDHLQEKIDNLEANAAIDSKTFRDRLDHYHQIMEALEDTNASHRNALSSATQAIRNNLTFIQGLKKRTTKDEEKLEDLEGCLNIQQNTLDASSAVIGDLQKCYKNLRDDFRALEKNCDPRGD